MGGTICRAGRQEDQVSKSILWLPWYFVNRFLESVRIAEEELGTPPTTMQIFATLAAKYGTVVDNLYQLGAILMSMLREDIIYSDKHSYRYTVNKQEGYYSYSELFRMKFPVGYGCDSGGRVIATTARTISLPQLKSILKSKDENVFTENNWIWDGEFRFLDKQPVEDGRIGFTSFPRSGNSFLRRYVEQITGVTSGSSISIHTSTSLQIMGLKGESHIDDSVWVAKSHHPFDIKLAVPMSTKKTFICVRHPLDVLPSYAALTSTMSHGNKPDFDFHTEYAEYWDWFVKRQIFLMQKFFATLIRQCKEKNHPLYIVRYEDLVREPKETLLGLMSFLLEDKDLEGSNVQRRIDQLVAQGNTAAQTYKLKDTTGKFDIHQEKYTPEQVKYVQETLGEQLYYFGYANVEDNPTGFFKYDEHTPENLAQHDQFRRDSAAALESLSQPKETRGTLVHNVDEKFPLLNEDDLNRLLQPSLDYAGKTLEKARAENQPAEAK